MRGHATLMSRASDEWATPEEFFSVVAALYGPFDLDAAADAANTKVPGAYFTIEDNALMQSWGVGNVVWLNPPYSKIRAFMKKAAWEGRNRAARVVCLVPARTDTRWWHETTPYAREVLLIKGRLKFGGAASAPFPSALVVFEAYDGQVAIRNWDWRG